jgi:hypothetical protein
MASATAPQNGKAIVPPDATSQVSYSGTPRGPDGTSYPDDYAPKMANPVTRMETFEEMGQADDQVRTALTARRQEISSANWQLSTQSTDATAVEILEFVEDNIYPLIDQLLRQLSGALQYGFAALEPVYQWSDRPPVSSVTRGKVNRAAKSGAGDRIWLRKLAHIRQTSVYTFKIAGPNDTTGRLPGDLITLDQQAFDGLSFRQRKIPAEKLLLYVYEKQGDDYWGVPPLRQCFKAWTYKTQIEKLNILHLDKFGVGTPVLEEGEGWGEADRNRAATMLMNWRSGARNFITFGKGGHIEIVSDEGKMSMSMLEWVKRYDLAIAKTMLTQLTELGSTDTGTRALGETFADQLSGIVQGDVEDIANLVNNGLIVPLVRWNFGDQDFYPTFAPSQRVRAGSSIATIFGQLKTAGVLHPRPEDEEWARDAYELPSVDLDTLKQEQDKRAAMVPQPGATANDPNNPAAASDAAGGTPSDGGPASAQAKPPVRIAASAHAHHDHPPRFSLASQIADGAPAPAAQYETSYRTPEFSAWEHGIVRPDVLSRDLDLQASRVTSETQDVLRIIDEELTRQVESLASKGAAALSAGIKGIAVPDRLRKQLRSVLLGAAQRARDYGAKAVIKLEATVDQAVEDEIDRREQSARSAASNALHQAAGAAASILASVASTGAKDALIGLSPGRTQDNVEGVVNTGFGIGRSETAQEMAGSSPSVSTPEGVATTAADRAAVDAERAIAKAAQSVARAAQVASDAAAGTATTADAVAATQQAVTDARAAHAAATQAEVAAATAVAVAGTSEAQAAARATERAADAVASATEAAQSASDAAVAAASGAGSSQQAAAAASSASSSTESARSAVSSARSATSTSRASASRSGSGGGRSSRGAGQVDLVAKVYSAVMDLGTCDECAKWDGGEFPIDYPEDFTGVQAPNPRCAGGYARCRCVFVYITDKESVPLVPASKGPQPIRRAA